MLLPFHRHEIPVHYVASLWSSCLARTLTFYKTNIHLTELLSYNCRLISVSTTSPRHTSRCRIIRWFLSFLQISLVGELSSAFAMTFDGSFGEFGFLWFRITAERYKVVHACTGLVLNPNNSKWCIRPIEWHDWRHIRCHAVMYLSSFVFIVWIRPKFTFEMRFFDAKTEYK